MIARIFKTCTVTTLLVIIAVGSSVLVADVQAASSELSGAIAQVQLFQGLTPEELALLEDTAALRQAAAGERIVEQGKALGKMQIIMAGRADVIVDGNKVVTLSGQSLVGEIEFLDQQPASADVVLLDNAEVLEIDNAALNALMEKQPHLGYVIVRRIAVIEAQRLRSSND
jgi:CRP/FNR family transcriptional regulator